MLPGCVTPEFMDGLEVLRLSKRGIPDIAELPDRLMVAAGGFHDVFGHVPLLTNKVFEDYMQAYGKGGQRAAALGAIDKRSRLYWYTVEFGLVRSGDGLKLYGAGIASSYTESVFVFDDPSEPDRLRP